MSDSEGTAVPKQVQQSEAATDVQNGQKTLRPMELLSEAAKFTIFGAFALYALGFLIWHSYLAEYGVASLQFLQTEYLSAAFCYLIIVAMFGVPAGLIYEVWFSNLRNRFAAQRVSVNKSTPTLPASKAVYAILSVWTLLILQVGLKMFPSSSIMTSGITSARQFWTRLIVWCVTCAGLVVGMHLLKIFLSKKYAKSRYAVIWEHINVNELFGLVLCIYLLSKNTTLDASFLLVTIGIYPLVSVHLWSSEGRPAVRTVVVIGIVMVVVLHAQFFGSTQFGRLSRSWGGGKPERAYVKFSKSYPELGDSLNLSLVENIPSLKGIFGPVSMLLRSDKELVFVNEAELNLPQIGTNFVFVGLSTNTTSTLVTNGVAPTFTGADKLQTQRLAGTSTLLVTNYIHTNVAPVLFVNPARLTAKQVRADAVDVLIYAK